MMYSHSFVTGLFLLTSHFIQPAVSRYTPTAEQRIPVSKQQFLSVQDDSFESWIKAQNATAFRNLLANIGPHGSKARTAFPGVIVASPSTSEPDYYYQWVRDAALVIRQIIRAFDRSKDPSMLEILEDYIDMQEQIQHVANPSGNFYSGGLGEPKFNIDGTAFVG